MRAANVRIRLEPWSVEIEAPRGSPLMPVLSANGVEFPCGGAGICGGCGVRLLSGSLPVSVEDKAAFRLNEIACGWRLACRARVEEPLVLECGQWQMNVLTDDTLLKGNGKHGLGIAIDLGTTTIAAQMIDLGSGRILGVRTALNPQMQAGADVMSRIHAVLLGEDLKNMVRAELRTIVSELAGGRAQEVCEVLIVGNTVMHHLFCGLDVEPLAGAPFVTPHPGTRCFTPANLGWPLPGNCTIRFAACIGSFVGADTLAGIIATGVAEGEELAALIDLGTNGEIAIGNRHGLVCASTAAGPAFEAGCIRMGMRASPGAIAHVELGNGGLRASTIGDAEVRGICGERYGGCGCSGLNNGAILPIGTGGKRNQGLPVSGVVSLYQSDIRELQLAKAAIASGLQLVARSPRGGGSRCQEDLPCGRVRELCAD